MYLPVQSPCECGKGALEGSLGLGTTEERRQTYLGAIEKNQVRCGIVSLSAQEAGTGGLDFLVLGQPGLQIKFRGYIDRHRALDLGKQTSGLAAPLD